MVAKGGGRQSVAKTVHVVPVFERQVVVVIETLSVSKRVCLTASLFCLCNSYFRFHSGIVKLSHEISFPRTQNSKKRKRIPQMRIIELSCETGDVDVSMHIHLRYINFVMLILGLVLQLAATGEISTDSEK